MKEIVVGPDVATGFPKRSFAVSPRAFAPLLRYRGKRQAEMYLDLLERVLVTGFSVYPEDPYPVTMLSPERLRNIRDVLEEAIWSDVPGDFIETGVWRGGACIYARACLAAFGDFVRRVYVADSFAGLPPPDPRYPEDAKDTHYLQPELAVSLDEVRENFEIFGFKNEEQTVFVPGWFDESLPKAFAPEVRFAVIRLDGDMYGSTMDALVNLYDRLSPGGFCIIDDFGAVAGCQLAVNRFRQERGIEEQIWNIDGAGIFWQKERG